MNEIEECWQSFWLPLLENPDETLDLDRLKAELYDCKRIYENVCAVYRLITEDEIINPLTQPNEVYAYYLDKLDKVKKEAKEELSYDLAMQFLNNEHKCDPQYKKGVNDTLKNIIDYLTENYNYG